MSYQNLWCSGLKGWPVDDKLNILYQLAGHFFVYAVATANFIDHKFHDPSYQLDLTTTSPKSIIYEGKNKLKIHTSLNFLYTIFQAAFLENNDDDDIMVHSILHAVV